MLFKKTAAFSPDIKYFACFNTDDELLIWETCGAVPINCKYDPKVYSTCTSMHWILPQYKYASPKKAKKSRNYLLESHLLAVGTAKGDILLYNIENKNLYLHLVARHSKAVNDICFYNETNSFFTCSDDKFIAIWDITSGQQKSKWKAGDSPVSSICAIDDNNMLSASTSILWWNISEKSIIKEFSGHSAEVFKLLPVNSASLNSCYFISAAVNDFKINAWSLNSVECQTPVASFVLPEQPADLDISKVSSKDEPLILSIITKNGFLHLFEHVLNGNLNQPIQPKVSIEISPETSEASVISAKLSPQLESCIIAFGSSKSDMTFKHIKIKEALKQNEMQNTSTNNKVKEASKTTKNPPINGIKSSSKLENSPKVTRLKEADAVISSYKKKLRSSSATVSLTDEGTLNTQEKEEFKSNDESGNSIKEIDIQDSKSVVDVLLKGIKAQNEDSITAILDNTDTEFISTLVKSLPTYCLKEVLCTLNDRLHQHKYSPTLSKWLKEILRVHLNYIIQSQDTVEALNCIKTQIDSMEITKTISQLSALKGFLNLQIQNDSSEESYSENEQPMEL